jgi:hypothetical protein
MMQIGAILSDYDGTLCPAASVKGNGDSKIPPKLEKILWNISKEMSICIVSSKDFFFLHDNALLHESDISQLNLKPSIKIA